ncbi:Pentatricopeptide repeat-containing protein [Colletotrichum aenigma]|uniref:Pentatricopeptide repeat-containing protein n=1 Tax=Colletotrichum aenigma TaxID=1215731 RepID=UPI00187316AF|nr:Pentatricopeptide repeat-containing protein [Colletotrichum aenigma]KAF5507876.1 Pentatricopeptide repeat-containing protein [Colletotrichum aenigma]
MVKLWVHESKHNKIDQAIRWSYLHHVLDKNQAKAWEEWKHGFANIIECLAGHVTSNPPARLLEGEAFESAINDWSSWDNREREELFNTVILSALWFCPGRAVDVLQTITQDWQPPAYAMVDVIHFLAMWQIELRGDELQTHAAALCDFVLGHEFLVHRRDNGRFENMRFRQNTIHNLMRYVDPARIHALYEVLSKQEHPLHLNTLFKFAHRLSSAPVYKQASLEIAIRAMQAEGKEKGKGQANGDLQGSAWRSLCTSILSLNPGDVAHGEFSAADAFSVLLEHGFVPNMINYTAMIRNLCSSGATEKAWKVYEAMKGSGIEPDSVLLSTLLDGAKMENLSGVINKIVEEAIRLKAVDTVFMNDLLYSILHFSELEANEKRKLGRAGVIPAFGPMLYYYSKAFNLAPLQALIPMNLSMHVQQYGNNLPPERQLARQVFPGLDAATSAVRKKMDPTASTLGIMFIAFVKNLAQPIKLISLYAYLRQLIINRHPMAVQHVKEKGTFMYDVILKALMGHKHMQRPALDIVGDMLHDTLAEREASEKETNASQETQLHPPPSIYTWNILLAGFLFNRDKETGGRIRTMMMQKGVEPNEVTWNTLISGYAGLQDVGKTVQSLKGLERAGYEASDFTIRGFSRLVNKERAFHHMEKGLDLAKVKQNAATMTSLEQAAPDNIGSSAWRVNLDDRPPNTPRHPVRIVKVKHGNQLFRKIERPGPVSEKTNKQGMIRFV